MVAFTQYAFNVVRFSLAWTVESRVIFCVLNASRFIEVETFRMALMLIINALKDII